MKNLSALLGAALVSLLAGCAPSPPVTVAPVGPNPSGSQNVASSMGSLQVFSKEIKQRDDQELGGDGAPGWYQHADYTIRTMAGKLVRHVENEAAHYGRAPEVVTLPPGQYLIRAQATDYFRVNVPVTIESGRTTRVHLDEHWQPSPDIPKDALVTLPDGRPVGWVSVDRM